MLVLILPAGLSGVALGILLDDLAGPGPLPLELCGAGILFLLLATARRAVSRMPRPVAHALTMAPILVLGMAVGSFRESEAALPTGPGTVSALAGTKNEVVIRATVLDDPRPRADQQQVVLENVEADGHPLRGRLLVWVPRAVEVGTGDRVVFRARLEQPQDFYGFAYRAFLARQGIGAIARTFDATVVKHQELGLPDVAAGLRGTLVDGLNTIVPEPEASLGAGILLGVRTSIDPAVSAAFATAGLTHVVAISGWNIAIVGALVARLLDGLRRRAGGRIMVEPITALAIGGYVVLVGSSPSVIRAALMAGALMLGRQAGSRAHAASALMLAALAMLLVAPSVLWDVGFQLSLLATAGLIAFGAPIERRLQGWPGWLREPVALTLAAQLTTLPVILATFERISLVAPLANVVVVPLVPLVMLASALAALAGVLGAAINIPVMTDAISWFAGGSAWLGLRLMILAGSAAAALPLAALPVQAPGWLALAWYPGLVLLWRRGRLQPDGRPADGPVPLAAIRRPSRSHMGLRWLMGLSGSLLSSLGRPRRALVAMIGILAMTTLASLPDGRLHLFMLDVGQGDGILVLTPEGRTMLVDAGPDPDQTLRQLGAKLPWWHRTIDVVILTHPHQDHVGGFPAVLKRFRVTAILDSGRAYPNPTYDQFLEAARAEPGSRYLLARAGRRLTLDPRTTLEIWYPSSGDAAAPLLTGDINNASVVGILRFGAFSALLTGDAKAPVEELLEQRSVVRPVDILKVGHHGSNSGTTPRFLAELHPAAGLISVGAGNRYGHPAPATIRALQAAGATVLRTDLDATVEVQTDGASWAVSARGRVVREGLARGATGDAPLHLNRSRTPATPAGSILGWPFRTPRRPIASWSRAGSRRGSSRTRREWRGSRRRRRSSWEPPGSPSTWASSRPPPSSMTSTSSRRGAGEASTA
ncbi:MAG: DUF4131 domain-containing protein [Chloroflexi bacterium]|nr:MAG: DUF4131 domain-containing protein [Chloroflexota bacterium]